MLLRLASPRLDAAGRIVHAVEERGALPVAEAARVLLAFLDRELERAEPP